MQIKLRIGTSGEYNADVKNGQRNGLETDERMTVRSRRFSGMWVKQKAFNLQGFHMLSAGSRQSDFAIRHPHVSSATSAIMHAESH